MSKFQLLPSPVQRSEVEHEEEPDLLREMFPYTEVPRLFFDGVSVPVDPPE